MVFGVFDLEESVSQSLVRTEVSSNSRSLVLFSTRESARLAGGDFSWFGKVDSWIASREAWSVEDGVEAIGFGEEAAEFDGVAAAELG